MKARKKTVAVPSTSVWRSKVWTALRSEAAQISAAVAGLAALALLV